MAKLKDVALAYEPIATVQNIADLDSVSLEIDVITKTYKEGEKDEYTQDVFTIDEVDYRVPKTVQAQLKTMIEADIVFKTFNVVRTGTGINDTVYTVIPHAQAK